MVIFAVIEWSSGLTFIDGWTKNASTKVKAIARCTTHGMTDEENVVGDLGGILRNQ